MFFYCNDLEAADMHRVVTSSVHLLDSNSKPTHDEEGIIAGQHGRPDMSASMMDDDLNGSLVWLAAPLSVQWRTEILQLG